MKTEKLINEYKKSMVETRRVRYPKIDLHSKFEHALQLQISKLRRDGLDDKRIIDRLQRAIPFYVTEE